MGALTLAVLVVLGFDEVDTGASPLLGEHICVVHVHIDGSAADPLRIGARSGEMDGQLVAMGERIPLVVVRGVEAQLLVVSNSTRYIRDHENRLDTDDALHSKIIGVADLQLCPPPLRGTFPHAGPGDASEQECGRWARSPEERSPTGAGERCASGTAAR